LAHGVFRSGGGKIEGGSRNSLFLGANYGKSAILSKWPVPSPKNIHWPPLHALFPQPLAAPSRVGSFYNAGVMSEKVIKMIRQPGQQP
jgi:hypothetical protein